MNKPGKFDAGSVPASHDADFTALVDMIGRAYILEMDGSFRDQLASMAGVEQGSPFSVATNRKRAWVTVGSDGSIAIERIQPASLPWVDLDQILLDKPDLLKFAQSSLVASGAILRAAETVRPLFTQSGMISRDQYISLENVAPIIEQITYKFATDHSIYLDTTRQDLLTALASGSRASESLTRYWSAAHKMAICILVASDLGSRPWLVEMADQFRWEAWTPTFWFTRERTTWLAAAAARSAIAFGPNVLDKYFALLEKTDHPLRAFDALFGIASIAVANPDIRAGIMRDVDTVERKHLVSVGSSSPYYSLAYADAKKSIRAAGTGLLEVSNARSKNRGLGDRAMFLNDPAAFGSNGRFLGFSLIPHVLACNRADHFPTGAILRREGTFSAVQISRVFRQAWMEDRPITTLH